MIFPQFFVSKFCNFSNFFANFAKIAKIADLAGALEFSNFSKFCDFSNFPQILQLRANLHTPILQNIPATKPHIPIANHSSCICNLIKLHFFPRLA